LAASRYLKELNAACANGDKAAARAALRRAISELETARAMFHWHSPVALGPHVRPYENHPEYLRGARGGYNGLRRAN
jgi:hypothetical protein